MFINVTAETLRPQDLCLGSGTLILANRGAGIDTPSGKVDLKVQRRNGKVMYVTWNRRTRIAIERSDA
jgi:hypothetical protein